MTVAAFATVPAFAIPPEALAEWLELARQIADAGSVPCQTSDPEAWWPDKRGDDPEPAVACHVSRVRSGVPASTTTWPLMSGSGCGAG